MGATKAPGNITISYNSNALAGYLNQASIDGVIAEIDTTDLASTAMEKIPGLGSWSVPVGGFWDSTLDGYLGPDAIAPPSTLRTLVVVIGPSGSQVTYTWTSNAFISGYKIAAEPGGALTWSGTLSVSGVPTRS